MSTFVDPQAVVHSGARLGDNVHIGPFAVVEHDVEIGDNTWIGPHTMVFNGTRMGRDCRVVASASIGGPPQDLKYKGEPTLLHVGDRCTIREFVTLNRATVETGKTVIGSDCLFMANSHVAHDCRVGNNVILANSVALGGHVHMDDWAIIGGTTPIHQFSHVGAHVMIGGGFRVVKDVPPFVLAGQTPLAYEGLNSIGLRRRGFTPQAIETLEKAYTLIYRSNLNVSQAVARIKTEVDQIPEIRTVLDFIAASKRGIISGRSHR